MGFKIHCVIWLPMGWYKSDFSFFMNLHEIEQLIDPNRFLENLKHS